MTAPSPPANILVVDDTPGNLVLLAARLGKKGHTVRPFLGGAEALEAAALEPPDLILLDINMPGMDGFEVCRRLKADPTLASIPVLFVTALIDPKDKERAFAAGGVDYISKPFHFEEVHARVETHLRLSRLTREADARFRATFESAGIGIMIVAPDGAFTMVNPRWCEMLGYDEEELLGLTVDDITVPGDTGMSSVEMRELLAGVRQTVALEKRYVRKDGSILWGMGTVRPVRAASGEVLYMVATVADITERKQAELALRKSETRFRQLLDATPDALLIVDGDGVIITANPRCEEVFGHPPCELLGQPISRLIPSRFGHHDSMMAEYRSSPTPRAMARGPGLLALHADGRELPVEVSLSPLQVDEGLIVLAAVRDISARRQVEEELERHREHLEELVGERTAELERANVELQLSEERYRTLFEASPHGILVVDPAAMRCRYANPAAARLFGFTREQLVGMTASDLHPKEALPRVLEEFEAMVLGDRDESLAVPCRRADGEVIYADINAAMLSLEGRHHMVGIFRDVTEQRRMVEELRVARQTAETASRAKSDFLASMSHELRTPLNAIIGFAEVLSDETFGELNERQNRYVGHVETSGKHLLALINDILDLSMVEAGKMKLALGEVRVRDLLVTSMTMIQETATRNGIRLAADVEPDVEHLTIRADERKLRQVLFNLLSNAVKFTPSGGSIQGRAWLEGDEVLVSVRDDGIGIAPEDQDRVFQEFEQVDSSLARAHQGTGLGLGLSRRLMELHGGRIWLVSEGTDMGSTFTIAIPLGRPEHSGREG